MELGCCIDGRCMVVTIGCHARDGYDVVTEGPAVPLVRTAGGW